MISESELGPETGDHNSDFFRVISLSPRNAVRVV
jgi:hypothetical protein